LNPARGFSVYWVIGGRRELGKPVTTASGTSGGSVGEDRLVAMAQAGDRRALEALARAYYLPLRALVLRCGCAPAADVDDIIQETFLRAFAALDRYQHRGHLKTWLFRIALNLARDSRRRAGRTVTGVDIAALADAADPGPDPGVVLAGKLDREALAAALARLPETQRETLVLRFYADLPVEEVARIVGCPEGTVKSRVHYALRKLRGLLARAEAPSAADRGSGGGGSRGWNRCGTEGEGREEDAAR